MTLVSWGAPAHGLSGGFPTGRCERPSPGGWIDGMLESNDEPVPKLMRGAWHVDIHRGELPALLEPNEMVAAVFNIHLPALSQDDVVQTPFGKFYADEVSSEADRRFALLHTWAPGSTSRFALEAARTQAGSCQAVLYNSVHPTSWLGKAYFRAIQLGHNLIMHIALRRLARAAKPAA